MNLGMGWAGGMNLAMMLMRRRVEALERQLAAAKGEVATCELRVIAAKKMAQGANLSRAEMAAHLGVSTRKLQRMEAAGTLRRCPNLGMVVRYAARDVLRLASAPR